MGILEALIRALWPQASGRRTRGEQDEALEDAGSSRPHGGEPVSASQQQDPPSGETETGPEQNEVRSTSLSERWKAWVCDERAHLRWLRKHSYLAPLAVLLIGALFVGEMWLAAKWGELSAGISRVWGPLSAHPIALVGGIAITISVLFGLGWLRKLAEWAKVIGGAFRDHPIRWIVVALILVTLSLWLADQYNSWRVMPFAIGQTEDKDKYDDEMIQRQFATELIQLAHPDARYISWKIAGPHLPEWALHEGLASTTVTDTVSSPLLDEQCEQVLQGPREFVTLEAVDLAAVLEGGTGSTPIDLGEISLGSIDFPLDTLAQLVLRFLPLKYREFHGQLNEINDEIEITITADTLAEPLRVTGPETALDEMLEYLAVQIALNLHPSNSSAQSHVSRTNREVAFALGNMAFRQGDYARAVGHYQVARRFPGNDARVDTMLGLAYYHRAHPLADADPSLYEPAVQAIKEASGRYVLEDRTPGFVYLACLYRKQYGPGGERERGEIAALAEYLRSQGDARTSALASLPTLGPGRRIAVSSGDVVYVDGQNLILAAEGAPFQERMQVRGYDPRQITLYRGQRTAGETQGPSAPGLVFIDADGELGLVDSLYRFQGIPRGPPLERAWGAIRQVVAPPGESGQTGLYLLTQGGEIYRWMLGEFGASQIELIAALDEVRQIAIVSNTLYVLDTSGSVWVGAVPRGTNQIQTPLEQRTAPLFVREMHVARDGTIYLLQENGNVSRVTLDLDERPAGLYRPEQIDPGAGTMQIFASGSALYVLKDDGSLWRTDRPRDPSPEYVPLYLDAIDPGIQFQEMYAVEAENSYTLYLLTEQGTLFKGTHQKGDQRVRVTELPGTAYAFDGSVVVFSDTAKPAELVSIPSPDGQVLSVFFNDLYLEADGENLDRERVVELEIPVDRSIDLDMRLYVGGYVETDPTSAIALTVEHAGVRYRPALPAEANGSRVGEFSSFRTDRLGKNEPYRIKLAINAEPGAKSRDAYAFLVIEEIEIVLSPVPPEPSPKQSAESSDLRRPRAR